MVSVRFQRRFTESAVYFYDEINPLKNHQIKKEDFDKLKVNGLTKLNI
jgi:hypothetical protein